MKRLELKGNRYGRLIVIDRAENHRGRTAWKCICDCGNDVIIETQNIKAGTISCGCYHKEILVSKNQGRTKHGLGSHPLYQIWRAMLDRCYNPDNKKFMNYGGRGIGVCDSWFDVKNFYNDVCQGYEKGVTSLDRINVNGNYEPENCRWVTFKQQARNKTNNHLVSLNGEMITLAEFEEKTGYKLALSCKVKTRVDLLISFK